MPDLQDLDGLSTFLKENMDYISEEVRLSLVEKLMPKDFTGALN